MGHASYPPRSLDAARRATVPPESEPLDAAHDRKRESAGVEKCRRQREKPAFFIGPSVCDGARPFALSCPLASAADVHDLRCCSHEEGLVEAPESLRLRAPE